MWFRRKFYKQCYGSQKSKFLNLLYMFFALVTKVYKHLFPEVNPRIRRFPQAQSRIHAVCTKYSRVYLATFRIYKSFCLWSVSGAFSQFWTVIFVSISSLFYSKHPYSDFSLIIRSFGLVLCLQLSSSFCFKHARFLYWNLGCPEWSEQKDCYQSLCSTFLLGDFLFA